MGCGGSINQVYDNSAHLNQSTRPLKLFQFFSQDQFAFKNQQNHLYLFGQTRTQRNIIKITILQAEKYQTALLQKINSKHRIPRPKIKYDPIQLLYEEAQETIPLNMYNSTSLPPFNLMFATFLSSQIIFLCGGTDYQFWNPVKQSFIYRLYENNNSNRQSKTIGTDISQKTIKKQFNKFQRLSFMKQARYSHMGIFIKSKQSSYVYVFGGYNQQRQALKQCQRYSIQKDEWEQIASMNIPRATGFCFQFMGKIYAFGGFSGEGKRSKKIQLYNIQKNAWEILNVKLHQGIQQGFIYSFNANQIIVAGGITQGGQIASTLQVNIVQQTYQWKTNMFQKGSLQKGVSYNHNLYLFGGSQLPNGQVYSYNKNEWTQIQLKSKQTLKKQDTYMFSYSTKPLRVEFNQKKIISNQKQSSNQYKYCIFGNDQYPLILQINHQEKQISKKAVPMSLRLRQKMGILKIDSNRYFICGGIDAFNNKATKATYIFQTQTNKVKQMPKMQSKKFQVSLCRKNQFIYCFGGKTKKRQSIVIGQCQKYNLWSNKWQNISNLIHPRSNCQTVVLESSIIVYGGYFQQQLLTSVQIYKISQNKFYCLKDRLKIISPIASICIDQSQNRCKVWILNKSNQSFSFQKYILKTDEIEYGDKQRQQIGQFKNQISKTIEVEQKEEVSINQIEHHEYINEANLNKKQAIKQKSQIQIEKPIMIPVSTIQIKPKTIIQEDDIQFDNPDFNQYKVQPKFNQIQIGLGQHTQKSKKQSNNQPFAMTENNKEIFQKFNKKNQKSISQNQQKNSINQNLINHLIQPLQTTQITDLKNTDKQLFIFLDQSKENIKSIYLLSKKRFISFDLLKLKDQVKIVDFQSWNIQYSFKWPQLQNFNYCKQVNFNVQIDQNK